MNNCPDILTIQAYLDGEEVHKDLKEHLQHCPACESLYRQLTELIGTADKLKTDAGLPEGFYERVVSKTVHKPFPAALVAAVMFLLAFLSASFLYPGYLGWWLSVGITGQAGYIIDFIMELLFATRALGYFWLIVIMASLVALEVLVLTKLKIVEG